jgi:hypothetical protein
MAEQYTSIRRWMKNALNQDSSYKITGEKKQGMSNFLQSQKLALLPITLPANEGETFTCSRRTRKTKTDDKKVDIMPVLANAGWGLEPKQKRMPFLSFFKGCIQTKFCLLKLPRERKDA